MIDHDRHVGQVLDKLDELGIAEDTIFVYSTDNGPHMNSWPDGAMTPFRSEKNTNWEGAFRVPADDPVAGQDPGGVVSNEIISHMDWLPTLRGGRRRPGRQGEAAGRPRGRRQDVQGPSRRLQLPALPHRRDRQGPADRVLLLQRRRRPRRHPLRQLEARVHGAAGPRARCRCGRSRSCPARPDDVQPANRPVRARTRSRPTRTTTGCSTASSSSSRRRQIVGEFLQTFMQFPPRMKAASFTVDQVLAKMEAAMQSGR